MSDTSNIQVGMVVYSAAEEPFGTVEAVSDHDFQVNGKQLPLGTILRTEASTVYISGEGMRYFRDSDKIPAAGETANPVNRQRLREIHDPSQIQAGVEVVGIDGKHVGTVKEANHNQILVSRLLQRDLYIPFDSILDASDVKVVLDIEAHEVGKMHWHNPPLTTGLGQ